MQLAHRQYSQEVQMLVLKEHRDMLSRFFKTINLISGSTSKSIRNMKTLSGVLKVAVTGSTVHPPHSAIHPGLSSTPPNLVDILISLPLLSGPFTGNGLIANFNRGPVNLESDWPDHRRKK
jgi:hypothetical protein